MRAFLPSWLAAAVLLIFPFAVCGGQELESMESDAPLLVSGASKLRTSQSGIDPDTVWIGHIADPSWRPRDRNGNPMSAASFPTIATGGYGPYHIGRGDNRPGIGPGTSYNGIWDWDHFQPGETDTLMGWWPVARPYQGPDVQADDKKRPFFGLDYGNLGNYVINQGLKRTFGVTGYWHRDVGRNSQPLPDTGSVVPGPNVQWRPLSGGASAWCGLRAHGDMTHIDPITGNPFNQSILGPHGNNSYLVFGSFSGLGTDANYPGYGSQWDQLLYQDVVLGSNADIHVSFQYATRMSRVRAGTNGTRIGYFYLDPTKVALANDGNFISATDAEASLAGPVDSLMAYIGLPVNEAACKYANGSIRSVYDPQRRWFSEVLKLDAGGGLANVHQLLSAAGESGSMASDGTITPVLADVTVPSTVLANKLGLGAGGGTVRLVFRVKTNRGNDDEDYAVANSFTSQTRGAALVDAVSLTQGGPNLIDFGDFESPLSIDNRPTTPGTMAWKSTGKPPGIYAHVHSVDPNVIGAAPWNDPCGPPVLTDPNATYRTCNMVGNVLTGGDHDLAEKPGGVFGAPDQDRERWVASPTINLRSNGPGDYNAMGIDQEIAQRTNIVVRYDLHGAGFRGPMTGSFWLWNIQSYPARQANGLEVWGEVRMKPGLESETSNTCNTRQTDVRTVGMITTSNSNGIPDSIRVYFEYVSRCYTLPFTASTCSPASGSFTGNHIDNLSLGLIRGAPPPALILADVFVDAFPATSSLDFTSAYGAGLAFDTCAAWVRTNGSFAPQTGLSRPAVQGDSAVVGTGPLAGIRVDLIFRILPGVGNHITIGNRASGIRKVPTSTAAAAANPGSANFWESYMGYNGQFGTIYPGNSHTMPGGNWDPHGWCSARMDTLEHNLFPCLNQGNDISGLIPGAWMSTYHEEDPIYTTLGIAKNRCFVVDPSIGRGLSCRSKEPTSVTECNIICGTHLHPVFQFPPLWTADLNSGLPPTEGGLPSGQTREFTKIIPDGQLTPGAHVQYFYRQEPGLSAAADHLPDTNFAFNPGSDVARWLHFSVLPDRWKHLGFSAGGTGMACLLVDDIGTGSLDEFFWVSAADSIGLTDAGKRGAHNGWRARGDQGVALQGNIGGDDTIARRTNGGQPGTLWDLWNGRSALRLAAGLGNRAAAQPAAGELLDGKAARTGPSGDMLRHFYRNLVILTGDLNSNFFGRIANRTDDDLEVLRDFLTTSGGTATPRTVYVMGPGFSKALTDPLGPAGGTAFLGSFFGATLRSKDYRTLSGNPRQVALYTAGPGTAMDTSGAGYGLGGMKFGVSNGCAIENDVLGVDTTAPGTAQMFWENVGAFGPYAGAILAPSVEPNHRYITYLDGSRITRIGSIINYDPQGDPILPMSQVGLRAYLFKSLNISLVSGCGPGIPVGVGDDPSKKGGAAFVNFMGLKSSNPMRSGDARISFGLANTENVEVRVYDVTGRLVRVLARRTFAAGQQHVVTWDGTNDAGERARSGIYFYQLKTPTWTSQKKLTVLSY